MSQGNTNLPAGWEWSTLGELCHPSQYGWTTKGAPDGTVKFLRTTDITHGPIDWKTVPYCSEPPADVDRYQLSKGDIVISRAGSVGFSALIGEVPQDAVFASYLIRFRPVDSQMAAYLSLYLQSPKYWRAIGAQAVGIALANVNAKKLSAIPVPVPPREEQARIVEKIKQVSVDIARGKRAFAEAAADCDTLRSSLLSQLAAPDFPRVTVGDVADVFVGATPSRKDPDLWNGGVPWVSSGEVAFCRINSTRETITEKGLGNPATRLHPAGTVLLAMIGEGKTRGQAAILDIAGAHNQNCASIRLDVDRMLPEFLFYCLLGQYERNREAGRGGQQPALNGSLVRAIEVPCPAVDVQQKLIIELEMRFTQVEEMSSCLRKRVKESRQLWDSLLYCAFSGQLGPQRTEDEPSDALLVRIADGRNGKPKRSARARPAVLVGEYS